MTAHTIKVSPVNVLNSSPCVAQAALIDVSPEVLHAEVSRAVEASDSARLVSLLHHMAAQDLRFAGKSPFLDWEKITETVPNFLAVCHLDTFDSEEACAWGHFIGHWMATKQNPERHYWAMNFLHQYAEGLSGNLRCDQLNTSETEAHRQLVSTLCDHLDRSQRDHYLKPLNMAFIEEFKLSRGKNDAITRFIIDVNNQPLLNAFSSEVFSTIERGGIGTWLSLANVMCSEPVCPDLYTALSAASVSHGLPAEGFLFDALKVSFGRAYAGSSMESIIKEIQDFMLNNKDRIKPLANHLLTGEHLKTFKQRLNLDLNYFFKPEDLPASARRLVLEADLGM